MSELSDSQEALPSIRCLLQLMREIVEAAGLRFLVHEAVPAGDGGVSLGQAVVGGFCQFLNQSLFIARLRLDLTVDLLCVWLFQHAS